MVAELKPFWTRRTELTVQNDCLLWGIQVIVPPLLREKILEELHISHPGMSRMKSLARCHAWWPKMDEAIERLCRACKACQEVKSAPATAPLHPWAWPTRPWQRVHIDFAGPFMGSMFFLLVDSHSKWPEIYQMSTTQTIDVLRHIFASYGLPEQIVSDNGSQFTSGEFAEFVRRNGIKHIHTALYHPSSNGAVERLVQSFKQSLKASSKEGKSVECQLSNFLLAYRVTPHATTKVPPCELFLNRSVRTRLNLLKPSSEVEVSNKQAQQKADHDGGKEERVFTAQQAVMVRNYGASRPKWIPGIVMQNRGPLSYAVQTDDGQVWHRHVNQMRKAELVEQADVSVGQDLSVQVGGQETTEQKEPSSMDGQGSAIETSDPVIHVPRPATNISDTMIQGRHSQPASDTTIQHRYPQRSR